MDCICQSTCGCAFRDETGKTLSQRLIHCLWPGEAGKQNHRAALVEGNQHGGFGKAAGIRQSIVQKDKIEGTFAPDQVLCRLKRCDGFDHKAALCAQVGRHQITDKLVIVHDQQANIRAAGNHLGGPLARG